ncbi:MAG: TlpA family protein disulfide reductase [Bdellovibrionia bacterium]
MLKYLFLLGLILTTPLGNAQSSKEKSEDIVGLYFGRHLDKFEETSKSKVKMRDSFNRNDHNLVFLWASWCAVCKKVMPNFDKVMTSYSKCGVNHNYIAVSDKPEAAYTSLNELNIHKGTLVDQNATLRKFLNLQLLPMVLIVNRDGFVTEAHAGGKGSQEIIKRYKGLFEGKECVVK